MAGVRTVWIDGYMDERIDEWIVERQMNSWTSPLEGEGGSPQGEIWGHGEGVKVGKDAPFKY